MSQAGITLLIIAGLCVLYIIDKLPVALVTTIGMLAAVAVPRDRVDLWIVVANLRERIAASGAP